MILVGPEDDEGLPHFSLGKIFYDYMKKKSPLQISLIDDTTNEEINYDQLIKISCKLATALTKLEVKKNDIVTIVAENNWKYLVSMLSCFFIGATVNLLNHDYTSGELKHFLSISQPVLIFCDTKTRENLLKLKDEKFYVAKNIITYDKSLDEIKCFDNLIKNTLVENFEPIELDPKDVALILTSSGTTGLPKCVMLTNENFRATMLYACDSDGLDINDKKVTLGYLPFFHIFGCATGLASILYGTKYIILNKFRPDRFLKLIEDHKVSKLFAVPPVIQFLAKHPMVEKFSASSVKDIICGGAPVNKELLEIVAKRLNIKSVRQIYGMTEICGAATIVPKEVIKYGSVGKVTKNHTIKVCNDDGKILPPYENGELWISGPGVMKGYLGNDVETEKAFDKGYLRSGDLGYYDEDGFFFIVDRLKEIIKYKGYQVSPAELENLLIRHPSVKDAGVVGIPDERAGEIPLAFVVKSKNVTEEELVQFIDEQVSVQKRLYGGVQFIQEIPKNASGKILRRELKKMVI